MHPLAASLVVVLTVSACTQKVELENSPGFDPTTTTAAPTTTTSPTTTTTTTLPTTTSIEVVTTVPIEIYDPRGEVRFPFGDAPVGYGVIPLFPEQDQEPFQREVSGLVIGVHQVDDSWFVELVVGKTSNGDWVTSNLEVSISTMYYDEVQVAALRGNQLLRGRPDVLNTDAADAIDRIERRLADKGAFQIVFYMGTRFDTMLDSESCHPVPPAGLSAEKIESFLAEAAKGCEYNNWTVRRDGVLRNQTLVNVLSMYSYTEGDNLRYRPIAEADAKLIEETTWFIDFTLQFSVFGPASEYFQ